MLILPKLAFAEYKMLSGNIPGLSNTNDLPSFINALYNIAIMVGVIVAVVIIAYSGLTYMTVDAVTKKTESKKRIGRALAGLLMLLATALIFNMINPEMTSLKILGK